MSIEEITINTNNSGLRIDKHLANILIGVSRTSIQKFITDDYITVNHKSVNSNYKLNKDDIIRYDNAKISISKAIIELPQSENIPLDILYEDKDILIINKPQGMVVHPSVGHSNGTLVNALIYHYNNIINVGNEYRPGIVHRIDKDTSGILLVCKNISSFEIMSDEIRQHNVIRIYRCIVNGIIKEDSGTINTMLARHPRDRKKRAVVNANGKIAITHYKVIERYSKYTHVECQLETGRTHQIRVHMAHIGHNILGDTMYGTRRPLDIEKSLNGQALHAIMLKFKHPINHSLITIETVLPNYFQELINNL